MKLVAMGEVIVASLLCFRLVLDVVTGANKWPLWDRSHGHEVCCRDV